MIFNIFKKKPKNPYAEILGLEDGAYVSLLESTFERMDPATKAHVAVAHENMIPIISAIYSHQKQEGKKFTIDDFIIMMAEESEKSKNDEINSRRFSWFLFAGMLARVEKITKSKEEFKSRGARIWAGIATEIPRLKIWGLSP